MSWYNLLPWQMSTKEMLQSLSKNFSRLTTFISLTSPLRLEKWGSLRIYSATPGKPLLGQIFSWESAGFKGLCWTREHWAAHHLSFLRKGLRRQWAGYGVGLCFANSLQTPQSLLLPGLKAVLHGANGDLNITQQTSWLWRELLKVHVRAGGLDKKRGKSGGGYYIFGCRFLAKEHMRCKKPLKNTWRLPGFLLSPFASWLASDSGPQIFIQVSRGFQQGLDFDAAQAEM